MEAGWTVCITDNPMGLLSYGATETIELLGLPVPPDRLMVHLNTFHTKKELDEILAAAQDPRAAGTCWSSRATAASGSTGSSRPRSASRP